MKSYEFQADMIFAQLVDGCVDLFHHLSTMDGDEVLEAVLEKWVDGKEDVAFSHHFTLSSVLGASIESHEHRQLGSVIEERGGRNRCLMQCAPSWLQCWSRSTLWSTAAQQTQEINNEHH